MTTCIEYNVLNLLFTVLSPFESEHMHISRYPAIGGQGLDGPDRTNLTYAKALPSS